MNVDNQAAIAEITAPVLPVTPSALDHVVSWFYWLNGQAEPQLPGPDTTTLTSGSTVIICTYMRAESLNRFLDSLLLQTRLPDSLIIVDASADASTEQVVKHRATDTDAQTIRQILYFRVSGPLKGLTRQRNYGLRWAQTDNVIFFDDDIVLRPDCLEKMEQAYRSDAEHLVGIGALIENAAQGRAEVLMWRIYLWSRMVTNLRPGRYFRSGIVTLWGDLPHSEEVMQVDWLPGCVTLWNTAIARAVGYNEGFAGYGLGEDLDFSLRASRRGKLAIACGARVLHFHASGGRPNYFNMGYMEIYNRYQIHRRNLMDRTWRDVVWFAYAWSLDTLLLTRHLLLRQRWRSTFAQVLGRGKAAFDLVFKGNSL